MKLPLEYENKMKRLLGDEYESYVESLSEPRYTCLRVNTLKISIEEFLKICPFDLEPVPWAEGAFYYDSQKYMPSKHPYYFAGLYYLQEPSATLPAATIPIEPGDRVLDICAAPGGKSTALACKLSGEGILISNDISSSRIKALQKNIENFGISNSIITCQEPSRLAEEFEGYFDKILIDAPCSGEGMFRKSDSMISAWEINQNQTFIDIQNGILKYAVKMLRPGGTLLYSTCTFDPREDEDQIMQLLSLRPDLELVSIENHEGFVRGNSKWSSYENASKELEKTVRLFPHKVKGEGHFVGLMKSKAEDEETYISDYSFKSYKSMKAIPEIEEFLSHISSALIKKERLELKQDKLFLIPEICPDMRGMRVMRRGVYLGELKTKRFEPSQSLAMILKADEFDNILDLCPDGLLVNQYLKGQSLEIDSSLYEELDAYNTDYDYKNIKDGWVLICVSGFPLGFGKMVRGTLKNKYLTGWRMKT
ncbi:MAG: RsmB/NOP family class I SAM-dependent RNA methyltransferase [Eubacterium sp.]|nr:RsmB/NOP family class I SAM-dependent RNA methyltransferase [Eubacterium sp.]